MARGWESKSIEDQQAQFAESRSASKPNLSPEQLAKRRTCEGLLLNRKRILQQLENAHDSRLRAMLDSALSALDSKIADLE